MKQTRILAYLCLLIFFAILMSAKAIAQTFTLEKTVTIDFGAVWCVPVYDGTNIIVSSESGGSIKVGEFDLSLNQVVSTKTISDYSDSQNGGPVAEHKQIFQNGYH